MKIKKAIVTGINGGAGSLLSLRLRATGTETRGLSMRSANVKDIANELKSFQPEFIFHAASAMDSSNLDTQVKTNLDICLTLGNAIGQLDDKIRPTVVNLGSAAELGIIDESSLPVNENYLGKPVSSYGLSKTIQSETLQTLSCVHNFRLINARLFNILWSPKSKKQFLNLWLEQLETQKSQNEFSLVTGDLSISRDFINAESAMNAIIALAERNVPSGIYNIAGGKETILADIVKHLSIKLGKKIKIINNPEFNAKNQPQRVVADLKKTNAVLTNKLGFELDHEIKLALGHFYF